MAHENQQNFCQLIKMKLPYFFNNKKVLDVGSLDLNGNNKQLFDSCDYVGIDIGEGSNVDFVSVGHEFEGPDEYYDTIISTEVFEHDMYYEKTILNIVRMLKKGGLFLFTCASTGRPEHGTINSSIVDAPFLVNKGDWGNYYKNLTEEDIRKIDGFNLIFPDGIFVYSAENKDLYFYGIKWGNRQLKYIYEL